MDAARARKLADRISQIVAEMLERRIKDPRLGFATVTEARLTNDLREATVYYTVLGTDAERADTAMALASATGVIRSEVGRQLGLRHTPSLEFVADVLPDTAQRIEELVTIARNADAELARSREGAVPPATPTPTASPPSTGRRRGRMTDGKDGLVIVDKPGGMTSHDVVARIRRLAGTRRVGHAGTLDPMATGVLVVGVEKATRLLGYLTLTEKQYDATIRLGQSTSTDDAEGQLTGAASAKNVAPDAIAKAVADLTGEIQQIPPAVSAIKVDGQRAYKLTRAGAAPELKPRPVTVYEFSVTDIRPAGVDLTDLDATVRCSSGTYIRALARDLGAALGTGGHLTALRRTRVGGYGLDQAPDPGPAGRAVRGHAAGPGRRGRVRPPGPVRRRGPPPGPRRPPGRHWRPGNDGRLRPGRSPRRPAERGHRPGAPAGGLRRKLGCSARSGYKEERGSCTAGTAWTTCLPTGPGAWPRSACSTACTSATSGSWPGPARSLGTRTCRWS